MQAPPAPPIALLATPVLPPFPAALQDRELNPYFRDGGSGVPPTEGGAAAAPAAARPAAVGDGGASWRLKALKRAQAQAGEEVRG